MPVADDLHFAEGYAAYRADGEVTLQVAVAGMTQVIELCHQHQVKRLLIDTTALTGFESPSMGEQFEIAAQWAMAARGAIKIALVLHPDMIDPERFGTTVARNRGLQFDTFASEAEALAWLLDPQTD
jgi:hypothetical protein